MVKGWKGVGRRRDQVSRASWCSVNDKGRPVVVSSDVCIVVIKEIKLNPLERAFTLLSVYQKSSNNRLKPVPSLSILHDFSN